MKKRAVSLFLVISMGFTFFYPTLSLNDNVLKVFWENGSHKIVDLSGDEISLTELMRAPKEKKQYKLKLLEWINEICQ